MTEPYLQRNIYGSMRLWEIGCCGSFHIDSGVCFLCGKHFSEKLIRKRRFLNDMLDLDNGRYQHVYQFPSDT